MNCPLLARPPATRVLLVPSTTPQNDYPAPPQQVFITEDVSLQEYPEESDPVMDYNHDQITTEHTGITNVNYFDNNMYYPYPDYLSTQRRPYCSSCHHQTHTAVHSPLRRQTRHALYR